MPTNLDAAAADLEAICAVVEAAFASSKLGHNGEAALVRALFDDGDVVGAFVAEQGGAIVGAAIFSAMNVVADGKTLRGVALAPVAVLPAWQGKGLGAALIEVAHKRLADAGYAIGFVLGDLAYYGRFGYRAKLAQPYLSPYAGPHFMALHLDKALRAPESGFADYAPAFARLGDG